MDATPADTIEAVVIEDHRPTRDLLLLLFRWAGVRAYGAATLAQGLEEVRTRHPRLVVVDRFLPDGDGILACSSLRAGRSDLWLVVMSAELDPQSVRAALDLGANRVVAKPYDPIDDVAALRAQSPLVPGA